MKSLFAVVKESLKTGGDWCTAEKALTLASLVVALRPKIVVEIGVWAGSSLIPLALAAKAIGTWEDPISKRMCSCTVVAIDPWDPAASVAGQDPVNAEWWASKERHDWAYATFQQRLRTFEIEHMVEVRRERSDVSVPPSGIGILHVDGNHGDQAVADVLRYAPNVRVGGVVILDDYHWSSGAVARAGEALEAMGFKPLYTIDTVSFGRVYQRVGSR